MRANRMTSGVAALFASFAAATILVVLVASGLNTPHPLQTVTITLQSEISR
jgi:hypothetical protein